METSFTPQKYHHDFAGLYIVLEGLDGSGKTTQAEWLKSYFESQGKEVITTREPRKSSGILAELNKNILVGEVRIPPVAYQYLFTADRILHHQELIVPALKEGKVVISDRSFWSAIPYSIKDWQESDIGKLTEQILTTQVIPMLELHQVVCPDVTFYLDIPMDVGLSRVPKKLHEAKEIYETKEVLQDVEKGYQYLLKTFPDTFIRIDANRSLEEVTESMIEYLQSYG